MTTSARDAKRSEAIFDLERLRRLWEPLDEDEEREAEELHVKLAAMVTLDGIHLPSGGAALGEGGGERSPDAADLEAEGMDGHLASVGGRFGRPGVAADPRLSRQHVWTRTRELTLQRFPEHHPALLPYLDEIERLLVALGFALPSGETRANPAAEEADVETEGADAEAVSADAESDSANGEADGADGEADGADAEADSADAEAGAPSAEEAVERLPQLLQELEDLVEALGLQVPPY